MFEDTPWLLKILVMVGGDGGGRGRATVQMPRLLQFYYQVGAGEVWVATKIWVKGLMRGGSAQDRAWSNNNKRV